MTTTDPSSAPLPAGVARYLALVRDRPGAEVTSAEVFTDDATVSDDGTTYAGRAQVTGWLAGPATQYEVTYTVLSVEVDAARTTLLVLLEGDFPGGTVTLRHTFDLHPDGRVAALRILP